MAIKKDYKQFTPSGLRRSKYDPQGLFYNHRYAFKQAVQLLSHHVFGFIVLVFFVSILLSMPLTLVYTSKIVNKIAQSMNSNAQISVYLETSLSNNQTQSLINDIEKIEDVRLVKYISPSEGLQEFEQYSGITKLTDYLQDNPIPGVIILKTAGSQPALSVTQSVGNQISALPGVNNVAVNNAWLSKSLAFIKSIQKSMLISTVVAFFLVFVIITTLFNLLLPESLIDTSKRTMIYLGLLIGIVTGVAADIAVNYFSFSINEIIQQLTFLNISTRVKHMDMISILINQGLSWTVLISAALIVRRYRIMSYR